jgi:outer membrane beta-barrel protein
MMKSFFMSLVYLCAWGHLSQAATPYKTKPASQNQIDTAEDIDTLGGNEDLMMKAQSLKSQTRARIVQDRIVDRRNKIEFGVSYGGVLGGDSYMQTQALGFIANYHITPRWSLGVQYSDFSNNLTAEGKRVFSQYQQHQAAGGTPGYAVDVDYPLHSAMAVINWYPIYGKTSFMDMGVSQFDLYLIGGAGQIQLSSGSTGIYAAGLGAGAWLTRHVSLRAEFKYQTYEDHPITGARHLDTGVANLGMGWIL